MKFTTRRLLELGGLLGLYSAAVLYVHFTKPAPQESELSAAPVVLVPADAPPVPAPLPEPPAKFSEATVPTEAVDRNPESPPKPAADTTLTAPVKPAVPVKAAAHPRAQPAAQPQACSQQAVYYECRPRGRRHRRWFCGD